MNVIEVHHLTKSYGSVPALRDLDLELGSGRVVGLMGDNGSGKTTLLKILAGVLADWQGSVTVAGHAPGPASKALVSYLPDSSFLPDRFTCPDAISMCADFFSDFDPAKARDMVAFFRLPSDRSLKELSKGMREKLQIALAMSREARVYLLDEPISGVDPAARDVILRAVISNFSEDALMLISTHLIADVEGIVDEVVFLHQGRVRLSGNADDLRADHHMGLDALFRKVYES